MASEPLVLLPGMGCTAALWSLLDLDVEPVTPVLELQSLDAEVERLLGLLPQRFALAGLSLGAIVAMALLRKAPERVARLALLSTNPCAPTPAQHAGWAEQRRLLADGSPRDLQTALLPQLLSPAVLDGRPDLVGLTLGMADELGPQVYDRQLRLQGTRVDERPGLARIGCPTLVLAARDDRLCGVERHVDMAGLVPGAELAIVEDCAHLSPLEQPAAVSSRLRRWLQRARRPAGRPGGTSRWP